MMDTQRISAGIIAGAELDAKNYRNVDLRSLLRQAFIIEDGLSAYLREKCGCVFVEWGSESGRYVLMSVRGDDAGVTLGSDLDFLTMLDMAMQRRE